MKNVFKCDVTVCYIVVLCKQISLNPESRIHKDVELSVSDSGVTTGLSHAFKALWALKHFFKAELLFFKYTLDISGHEFTWILVLHALTTNWLIEILYFFSFLFEISLEEEIHLHPWCF